MKLHNLFDTEPSFSLFCAFAVFALLGLALFAFIASAYPTITLLSVIFAAVFRVIYAVIKGE